MPHLFAAMEPFPPPAARHGRKSWAGRLIAAAALAALTAVSLGVPGAAAHPWVSQPLDQYGGHFDEERNVYHYHRPKANIALRKREFLTWIDHGKVGELRGTVDEVERPDALWVRFSYRPSYQELVPMLSPGNRDDRGQRVRVWFRFVSPEASVSGNKAYREWFRKKVVYELEQKLKDREVTVQFELIPNTRRINGMVLLGEENINLWLVLNGWSYFLLSQGETPFEKQFIQAETIARREKAGLWQAGR